MRDLKETIKLLEHIHKNPQATQRELVDKLDISLGKVNFLVKALAEKGIIKLQRFKSSYNKMGYLYLITPKGMSEKARLTKEFFNRKLEEYDAVKNEIERLKLELNAISEETINEKQK